MALNMAMTAAEEGEVGLNTLVHKVCLPARQQADDMEIRG